MNALPEKVLGGRYTLIHQVGQGGFGHTYLAEDRHLPGKPRCIVKQLKPQNTDPTTLETARRLFDVEAQVLYKLGSHDQIPRLLAHFEEDQEFYLVQELIEGEELSKELLLGQPWNEIQVIVLLRDVLQVLEFVHQQDVIHRDIKPSNLIRRRQDGRVVLIDFGAVKQISTQVANAQGQTNFTIAIGTPGYMPNEQLAGNPRFSSDLYAVGMLGIQALTGLNPKQLPEDPQTSELVWRAKAEVRLELADVLDKMVRYDHRTRYQSATEVLADLHSLLNTAPTLTPDLQGQTEKSVERVETLSTANFNPVVSPQTVALGAVQNPEGSVAPTLVAPTPVLTRLKSVKPVYVGGVLAIALAVMAVPRLLPLGASNIKSTSDSVMSDVNPVANSSPEVEDSRVTEFVDQGDALRSAGRYEAAIVAYDQAIAISPTPTAQWGRCYALNLLQRYEEALTACTQATESQPNYAEAWSSKGYALDALGRQQEALAAYDKAVEAKPDYADAWNNRGTALLNLQRYEEAIASYDKALNFNPNSAEAWNNRGVAFKELQQYSEAIASYDKALAVKQDYAEAWNNRGNALLQLQQPREALAAYERALQVKPNDPIAAENRKRLLVLLNQ